MRLKTNIFIWIFVAAVLPLTALVLVATNYAEHEYRRKVDETVNTSLSNLISEIDRRLHFDREVTLALAEAPAMQAYLPVLADAAAGRKAANFTPATDRLTSFLEGFQAIVPSLSTLRVLTVRGNTLIKVHRGEEVEPTYQTVHPYPLAEPELARPAFTERLAGLRAYEVGFLTLPPSRREHEGLLQLPLLDAVVPLMHDGHVVGYLVAHLRGNQIDRILDSVPRAHAGELIIAEVNPAHPERNGMRIYDDKSTLHLADTRLQRGKVQPVADGQLWEAVRSKPYGAFTTSDGRHRLYYQEYLPYPNQLVSWVVASRVSTDALRAPFRRIRVGILVFAGIALLVSLVIAQAGARTIARPVTALAARLKAYGEGNQKTRATPRGAREIREVAESFNYMAASLERAQHQRDRAQQVMLRQAKLASIGELAAGIGHEINNPLNNILSYCKLVERELPQDAARARSDLGSMREEALRASQIVRGILNFARQVPPQYSRFGVRPWLEESVGLVRQQARSREVTIDIDSCDECEIEGDRGQLQQALINLLLNAIQGSPPGARVRVEAEPDDEYLDIRVRDEGPGIEPEALDKAFDPFYTTKPVGEGSGLGLSISLGIVQHHNGELTLENHPDGGAVATMRLQRGQRDAAQAAEGG